MRLKRGSLMVEPPSVATGDIAFNLIVFFLVCASTLPDSGRKQNIPSSETVEQQNEDKNENVEIALSVLRDAKTGQPIHRCLVNGEAVATGDLVASLRSKLDKKAAQEDKVVVVKSKKDVPYQFWITVTTAIEDAGGVVTLQLEEERTVTVPE